MSEGAAIAPHVIEPFDPARHDRTAFTCGVEQIDSFFRKTANKLARAGNVRVLVMANANGAVIGFYALNAHVIDYAELPERCARTRPGHGSIPAAYISMIGVDRRFAGNRYGDVLLVDALLRIVRAADDLALAVVVLDLLDCDDPALVEKRRRLYVAHGFKPLPSNDMRLFLPVATARKLLEKS